MFTKNSKSICSFKQIYSDKQSINNSEMRSRLSEEFNSLRSPEYQLTKPEDLDRFILRK